MILDSPTFRFFGCFLNLILVFGIEIGTLRCIDGHYKPYLKIKYINVKMRNLEHKERTRVILVIVPGNRVIRSSYFIQPQRDSIIYSVSYYSVYTVLYTQYSVYTVYIVRSLYNRCTVYRYYKLCTSSRVSNGRYIKDNIF